MDGYKKGGEHFAKMYKGGSTMGYSPSAKHTSSDFKMKTSSMKSMDHANTQRKKASNERDAESGGKTPVRPKYKEGGQVKLTKADKKKLRDKYGGSYSKAEADKYLAKKGRKEKRGSLFDLARKYGATSASPERMKEMGFKKGGTAKRKAYSGYNEQPGGGGNEDSRYMKKKGGYMKGGKHSGDMGNYSEYAGSRRERAKENMPANVKAKGGKMKKYAKGGYTDPGPMPANVKAKGGYNSKPMYGKYK